MDDKQEGEGVEIWPDGAKYEGKYHLGKKHGKGRIQFADGSIYEGEFHENAINGYGKYVRERGVASVLGRSGLTTRRTRESGWTTRCTGRGS